MARRALAGSLLALAVVVLTAATYTTSGSGRRRIATEEADQWITSIDGSWDDRAEAEAVLNQAWSEIIQTAGATQNVPGGSNRNGGFLVELGGGAIFTPGGDIGRWWYNARGMADRMIAAYSGSANPHGRPRAAITDRFDVFAVRKAPGTPPASSETSNDWAWAQDPRYRPTAYGCAHGTLSHLHTATSTDRECGWPSVPMCVGGTRDGKWCPCDADGVLSGGACEASFTVNGASHGNSVDCPGGGTCTPTAFDKSWVATIPTTQFTADMTDAAYSSVSLAGNMAPWMICDGYSDTGQSCPNANSVGAYLNDATKRVRRYTYQVAYGGAATGTVSSGSGTSVTASGSPGWTTNQHAGRTFYLRAADNAAYPESRTIVSNTSNTVTLSSGFTVPAASGDAFVIVAAGNTMTQAVTVSAVETDMRIAAYQRWSAARMLHAFYDMGFPGDWPIEISDGSKPGKRAYVPTGVANPCSIGGSHQWSGVTRLAPVRLANTGCVTLAAATTHDTLYGPGEYQAARAGMLQAILDQTNSAGDYWTDVTVSETDAPSFLATNGAASSTSVTTNARYSGTRYTTLTRTSSYPSFTGGVALCGNGAINSGEQCDDGNTSNGDGCSSTCQTETSPITASLVANCTQKSSGVYASPQFCQFDASGTTHSDSDIIPFIHLDYTWDFGDSGTSGTGNWSYGAQVAKNAAYGPEAAHVFECASASCSYTVTLTVKDYAGNTKTATTTITVTGEDYAWTDANTYCVCDDSTGANAGTCTTNGVAGFRGCPIDNNDDGDCLDGGEDSTHCIEAEDFDAQAEALTAGGKRVLWRAGDTFTADADTTSTAPDRAADGVLWGCYGSAATTQCTTRPVITYAGSTGDLFDNNGTYNTGNYRFRDLEFNATSGHSNWDGGGEPKFFTYSSAQFTSNRVRDLLFLRLKTTGVGECPYARNDGPSVGTEFNERIAYVGSECDFADAPSGGWPVFTSYSESAVLGSKYSTSLDTTGSTGASVLGFRSKGFDRLVIASNTFDIQPNNVGGASYHMSLRTCATPNPADCSIQSGKLELSDNFFYQGSKEIQKTVEILNNSTPADTTVDPSSPNLVDVRVERNMFGFSNVARSFDGETAVTFDGVDNGLFENNICDFRGMAAQTSNADTCIAQVNRCFNNGVSCDDDSDIYVQHNIALGGSSTNTGHDLYTAWSLGTITRGYCANNIAVDLASGKTTADTDPCAGTWTAENPTGGGYDGVAGTSCPFYGTGDNCTLTAASATYDFGEAFTELDIRTNNGGLSIDNDGYDFGGGGGVTGWSFYDIEHTARPSTGRAIGPFQ